jgi:mannosyltransferase OCH1-like enzyme
MPPKMKECVETLKKDNPEFEHHLYDDAKCRTFISKNFEKNVLCAYDKLIPGAYKADLVRYCIMYKYGGVYLDIKFKMKNGFKLIDYVDKEYYLREGPYAENQIYIANGFIVAYPNNPLWLNCINKIVDNVNNKWYGPTFVSPTGPELLYSLFDKSKIKDIIFKYSEPNDDGKGIITNIKTNIVVMSHYDEYRDEQKRNSNIPYYKDLWYDKNIYNEGICKL